MNFLAICLEFSITYRVGTERNGTIIFISLFLIYFQPILAWNEFIMVFLNFFCYFFGIFFHASGKNGTERQFLVSLFRSLFLPILAWNEATMVFFYFLNLLAICLEFSITHQVGTERNGTIIFISLFLIFFQPILAWNELIMVFLIFWIFCYFFWNFLLHIGQERNGTIIFIFSLSQPLPTYFGLKWGSNGIFLIFWIFLLFFFFGIFYYTSGTERNDNFYFLSFPAFSSLFWLKMKPQWYFLIFWIFLPFFRIVYHASGKNGTEG